MSDTINNTPTVPTPAFECAPRTVDEVLRAVDDAANGRTPSGTVPAFAKAVAGFWGFNVGGTTNGTRVRVTNLVGVEAPTDLLPHVAPRPLPSSPIMPNEAPGPLRRVYAGTTYSQVNTLLAPLTVRNQPGFGDLTVGGVTLVGGHGSGLVEGNMASQVRSLDLVVVNAQRRAELVRLEPASDPVTDPAKFSGRLLRDDALFAAAKVSFGTMGVLTSVLLDTRPQYRLEEDRDLRWLWKDFAKIESQVRDPAVSAVHLWVNPYATFGDHRAVQSTYRRSLDTQRNTRGPGIVSADTKLSLWFSRFVASSLPGLLPLATDLALWMVTGDDVVMPSPIALDFGPPNRMAVSAASCSVPAADLKDVLQRLLEHFKEGFGQRWASSPVGIRWVKASDAPLAPQHGRDSVMIEVPVLQGTPNLDQTLQDYVTFMVNELGARPHWGQRLWLDGTQLRKVYGEANVALFRTARATLDPLGVFDNELTRALAL